MLTDNVISEDRNSTPFLQTHYSGIIIIIIIGLLFNFYFK